MIQKVVNRGGLLVEISLLLIFFGRDKESLSACLGVNEVKTLICDNLRFTSVCFFSETSAVFIIPFGQK